MAWGFSSETIAEENSHPLSSTEWRLVQCTIGGKLKAVNFRSTLHFNGSGTNFTGNDGCSDIGGPIAISERKIQFKKISAVSKKQCADRQKLSVARIYIDALKNHSEYKIKDNYLIFYTNVTPQLVFAKIITEGSEGTILKRSARVESQYKYNGKSKYLQVYDYIDNKHVLVPSIQGLTYIPGYVYEIHLQININESGKKTYKLIKLISRVKK